MKKIKNRINFALDYLMKKEKLKCMPIEICIGITNSCNSRCIMCPTSVSKRGIGFMSFQTFKKIVDQVKDYVEILYLHLDGESLLHPKLFDMIKYCKEEGITTGLSTNAIILDEEKSKKIIESGIDYLILSIDAVSRETYFKIKSVDKYDDVVNNVTKFLKIKRKKPYTVVQMIHTKENDGEVKMFRQFWKGKNVDDIRIKPSLTYRGFFKDVVNETAIINKPCFLLWRMLVFYWDGTAVLCCLDLLNSDPIGNINENSVAEIWNSKKMLEYRKLHINKEFNKINLCKECNVPGVNLLFLAGSVFLDTFTIKKLIVKLEKIPYIKKYV